MKKLMLYMSLALLFTSCAQVDSSDPYMDFLDKSSVQDKARMAELGLSAEDSVGLELIDPEDMKILLEEQRKSRAISQEHQF